MPEGFIKAFNPNRGFGFVSAPGEPDLFFHIRDADECLPLDEPTIVNRRVSFKVVTTHKGLRAVDLKPAH